VLLLFYKTITLWFPCLDGLIQTLGNVARVKKIAQNHSPSARVRALFLTLATFPRVWIRPSKNGNHKVIVYSWCISESIPVYSDVKAILFHAVNGQNNATLLASCMENEN
jgi:hypothetical protein